MVCSASTSGGAMHQHQHQQCCSSTTTSSTAVKRTSSVSSASCGASSLPYACMVTPPMTLPSRGWGDSGSEGSGSRRLSGFSYHSSSVGNTDSTCGCSVHDSSGHGSMMSGVSVYSSGSTGSGRSGVGADGKRGGQQQQQQLEWFNLSDGFSSAEEETWGSEGEIEETALAGRRRALVTGGRCRSVNNNNNRAGMSINNDDTEDAPRGEGGEEAGGLLATVGGYSRRSGSGNVAGAAVAPACAGDVVSIIGSRRKAALGAGRAKRRGSFGKGAGTGGTRTAAAAAAAAAESRNNSSNSRSRSGNGVKAGLSPNKPPVKVSRSLFIEIENKASETPRKATPQRGRAASRRHHNGAAVHGRTSASGEDADDEQGDSDDEAICGCARRCLRVADAWYHTLTGSTAKIKFSEVDQGLSSSMV